MSRPCTCDKSKAGEPWIDGVSEATGCYRCWLYHNNPEYRDLWRTRGPDRKIIIENWLTPGDLVVMTATLEAFAKYWPEYQFKIRCHHPEVYENNPHVKRFADDEAERTIDVGIPASMRNQGWRDARYINSFTETLSDILDIKCKSATTKPRLYLSADELNAPRQVDGDYALINSGYKLHGEVKNWGYENWCEVAEWITSKCLGVVQVGGADDKHRLLPNAIDLRGKTSIRQLFMLMYHATFGCGHESFLHHVAAAFEKPFICVASGLFPRSWTEYNTETHISRHGTMDCCRSAGCYKWRISSCVHKDEFGSEIVSACMTRIKPAEVIGAIEQWYDCHGVLNKNAGKAIKKSCCGEGVKPASKAIVTAFFDDFEKLKPLALPSIQDYAKRIGADLVVLDQRRYPGRHPWYEKFQIYDLLEKYQRLAWIDGDTVISSGCDDLFSVVPYEKVGAFDESWFPEERDVRARVLIDCCQQLGMNHSVSFPPYYNCGVMVASKKHQALFAEPQFVNCKWPEQTLLNVRMREWPVHNLPETYNQMNRAKEGFIRHMAGMTIDERIKEFQRRKTQLV